MDKCERLRPLLFKIVEGEGTPEEAFEVGSHLSDCTVCRIRMAREQRLADLVSNIDEPVEVDESFLRRVMESLPDEPPRILARKQKRRGRRGLKLASFLVLGGLLGAVAYHVPHVFAGKPPLSGLQSMEFETLARLLGGAREQIQFLLAALAGIGTRASFEMPSLPTMTGVAIAAALVPLSALFLAGPAFVMLAARNFTKNVR